MLNVGTKVKVSKGCNALGITKGTTAVVTEVTALGADYSHAVKVVIKFLNGFKAGKSFSLSARHMNRLSDGVVTLSGLRPEHKIQVVA